MDVWEEQANFCEEYLLVYQRLVTFLMLFCDFIVGFILVMYS